MAIKLLNTLKPISLNQWLTPLLEFELCFSWWLSSKRGMTQSEYMRLPFPLCSNISICAFE